MPVFLLEDCLSGCEVMRSLRGVINSVYSPLVIHILKLYRIRLYFSPSLFIKKKNCFIIFPTVDVHIDED